MIAMNFTLRLLIFSGMLFLFSCVSTKEFNKTRSDLETCLNEKEALENKNRMLKTANTELQSKEKQLALSNEQLNEQLEDELYRNNLQTQRIVGLEQEIETLQKQIEVINTGSNAEIEQLLGELNRAREDLVEREENLRLAQAELASRSARLEELQKILVEKEKAVTEIKAKVMDALVGFNNNGLTVHEKNGKVYVSLDEKLLFKTGQWTVDARGQEALKELAVVLAQNPDINIMVEGHTDNVPMNGSGAVKDNWDLSVMRATAVTKILTRNNQLNPERIIAAGRSEYHPVSPDNTPAGRQMNRRTEIILSPKLDELLEIIEMN
jgi:chemotaxis protein MotB